MDTWPQYYDLVQYMLEATLSAINSGESVGIGNLDHHFHSGLLLQGELHLCVITKDE